MLEAVLVLLAYVLVIAIVFTVVWWLLSFAPLPQPVRQIVMLVVLLALVLWLLKYSPASLRFKG